MAIHPPRRHHLDPFNGRGDGRSSRERGRPAACANAGMGPGRGGAACGPRLDDDAGMLARVMEALRRGGGAMAWRWRTGGAHGSAACGQEAAEEMGPATGMRNLASIEIDAKSCALYRDTQFSTRQSHGLVLDIAV